MVTPMQIVFCSTAVVAILGLTIGIFLGMASEIFKTDVDERVAKIRECLPGNNCGGCGYAGCDAVASAIAKEEVLPNICPVGGEVVAQKISLIMGVDVDAKEKKVAFVHCNGSCINANKSYQYTGERDCNLASILPNSGEKKCKYACLGYGLCVKACMFGAIDIVDGVAVVDKDKCKSCGACVKACPMHIIDLVPYDNDYMVVCSNRDKGRIAMEVCKVSCIGCGMCERICPKTAIKVDNGIAVINYDLCDNCAKCVEKCPRKCIV